MKKGDKNHKPEKDLHDLQQENEFLKKLVHKYQSLINHIPNIIWTADINGNTKFISNNIQDMYGYTPDEIYQQGDKLWFGRIHPDDVEMVKKAFHDLFDLN